MLNVWSALEGRERVGRGLTRRGSGRGRPDRGRQVAEEDGVRAGAGEGDAHPAGGLGDAGGDLQEPEPDRREFGLGEGMCLGNGVAHGEDQPMGGGVQESRIWLAVAARQLVRSEGAGCSLIRFSAWPRAQ